VKHYEKKISSEQIYDGMIVSLRLDQVELENGDPALREVIDHPGGVAVLAVDTDGNILFVSQYRYAVQEELIELPAGKLERGEDPAAAGMRELEEETGYRSENLKWLITLRTTVAFCNERVEIFVAKDLIPSHQNLDEDEYVDVKAYSVQELKEMIFTGKIEDSKTIAAILAYESKYLR